MAEALSMQSLGIEDNSNCEAPPNVLMLESRRDLTLGIGIPKFKFGRQIGKFKIAEDQEYSEENAEIPKLIPLQEIDKLRGADLGIGYDDATFIASYKKYHELKLEYFLKWLIEHQFFSQVKTGQFKQPDFICFGGRIFDTLQSPLISELCRFGGWEFYAAKFNDTIFLWDVKKHQRETKREEKEMKDFFFGAHFEALLTGSNPASDPYNELELHFQINEISFGNHQLLTVNQADAIDSDGKLTGIRLYNHIRFQKSKNRKNTTMWAQNNILGVENFIFGERDYKGSLLDIKFMTLKELQSKVGSPLAINRCLDFQNRLLNWIKAHLTTNDPTIVKKFSWVGIKKAFGNDRVTCLDVPVEETLSTTASPQWFINQVSEHL